MESAVLVCDCEAPTADAAAAPGAGGNGGAAGGVAMLRRSALAACLTCPLCGRLLRDATTITECLHTFCRKCISEEFISKEVCCCPICNIDLGCAPLEKLRVERSLQYVRSKVFPFKKQRAEGPEVTSPITSPTETANQGTSSAPEGQASEAATAGASVGTEPSQAQVGGDPHAWEGPWIPVPEATLVALDDGVRRMGTAMSTLRDMSTIVESLHARSMEKSLFIHHLWDRLDEETQLRQGLAEQLDAARREVAELAPLGRDLANLRIMEADAREHAREAEEKTRAHAAESERLRKERDDLLRAVLELRAERDLARQVIAAEVVKSHGLEKELAGVKDLLSKERDEHDALRVAVGVVCDDLTMVPEQEQGSSSVAARTVQITERAREMARKALHFGVHQSLAIARSHFEKLEADLATMSQGFAPGYSSEADLEEIEKMVAPCRRT